MKYVRKRSDDREQHAYQLFLPTDLWNAMVERIEELRVETGQFIRVCDYIASLIEEDVSEWRKE